MVGVRSRREMIINLEAPAERIQKHEVGGGWQVEGDRHGAHLGDCPFESAELLKKAGATKHRDGTWAHWAHWLSRRHASSKGMILESIHALNHAIERMKEE